MRGSSAIEKVLNEEMSKKLDVLVVWEPMLPTDWRRPTSGTLSRISDPRVAQFWDPDHLVAHEIERGNPPASVLPPPLCCNDHNTYWDMAILYPRGATWSANAPAPLFRDGPVVRVASEVEAKLNQIAQ